MHVPGSEGSEHARGGPEHPSGGWKHCWSGPVGESSVLEINSCQNLPNVGLFLGARLGGSELERAAGLGSYEWDDTAGICLWDLFPAFVIHREEKTSLGSCERWRMPR